jgi:hypothetical protein
MAEYSKASPYYGTKSFNNFLDIWEPRTITKDPADTVFVVESIYQYRPDLLASDLYGDPSLWWVFAARNPNTIKDPIFDMKPGVAIFLPNKDNLIKDLGL